MGPMDLQALYRQIAQSTGALASAPVLRDGNLQVAYENGLLAYVTECAALLVGAENASPSDRSGTFRQLLPELAARLDANEQLFPAQVSGANAGFGLCALGQNPFAVSDADEVLVLDSPAWKLRALTTITRLYERAGPQQRARELATQQAMELPEAPVNTVTVRYEAEQPLVFLIALVRMVLDSGFPGDLLAQMAPPGSMPPWTPSDMTQVQGTRETGVPGVRYYQGAAGTTIYYASFIDTRNVLALMRALVATLYARQHASDQFTLAALPQATHWALHRLNRENKGVAGLSFYLSVVCQPLPNGTTQAGNSALEPLMYSLWNSLGIAVPMVSSDAAHVDPSGAVRLQLAALLNADIPALFGRPNDPEPDPMLWLQRRQPAAATDPKVWYASARQPVPAAVNSPYQFRTSVQHAQAMDIATSLETRLALNPNCRHCGRSLPTNHRSLLCAQHRSVTLDEQ